MNKKVALLLIFATLCVTLCGCGNSSKKIRTSRVTKQTAGAIKAEDTNVIPFDEGTKNITLPNGFRYIKEENKEEDLTSYFVFNFDVSNAIADSRDGRVSGQYEEEVYEEWKREKEQNKKPTLPFMKNDEPEEEFVFDTTAYSTPYNENTYFYAFEGIDRSTTADTSIITSSEVSYSFNTYINKVISEKINPQMLITDAFPSPHCRADYDDNFDYNSLSDADRAYYDIKLNGDYYAISFTCYSGTELTTTYNEMVYPKAYYGIFLLEKDITKGSIRKWYGFVFSNNSIGDYFTDEEYTSILGQIKSEFGITKLHTDLTDKESDSYDPLKDWSNGMTYEQLAYFFSVVDQYFVIKENTSVDINSLSEEEVKNDESITEVDVTSEVSDTSGEESSK